MHVLQEGAQDRQQKDSSAPIPIRYPRVHQLGGKAKASPTRGPDQIQKGQRMMAVLTAEAEGQEQSRDAAPTSAAARFC
jgi:hypothetical protein